MKLLLLTTLSLAVAFSSAFHVGVWKDHDGVLKRTNDERVVRFPKNKRVEKYTDFHTGIWKDRGGLKPTSDERVIRFHKNKRVDKYTDSDRALRFPQESQIRHDKDQAPPLDAKERIVRGDFDTVLSPGAHPDQDYPISDRKWGFPKAEKVRKDKGQAPKLKDKERLWNQPKPGKVLHP